MFYGYEHKMSCGIITQRLLSAVKRLLCRTEGNRVRSVQGGVYLLLDACRLDVRPTLPLTNVVVRSIRDVQLFDYYPSGTLWWEEIHCAKSTQR